MEPIRTQLQSRKLLFTRENVSDKVVVVGLNLIG